MNLSKLFKLWSNSPIESSRDREQLGTTSKRFPSKGGGERGGGIFFLGGGGLVNLV